MDIAALDSKYLRFGFTGSRTLLEELTDPFVEVTVTLDRVRTPTKLVLWRHDDTGIAIWAEMHDVAERIEVGVLNFAATSRTEQSLPDGYWETAETFPAKPFSGQFSISKLAVDESGYLCESGLVVTPNEGEDLFIVADAFPCHIAVLGLDGLNSNSRAEYNLSSYKRVDW